MDYSHHDFYGRNKFEDPRSGKKGWWLFAVVAALVGAAGLAYYEYKTHPAVGEKFASYHAAVSDWLAKRKESMHHGIAKVKKQAARTDEASEKIHFEFYNTLQEMHSMQAEVEADTERKQAETESKKTQVKTKMADKLPAESAHIAKKKSEKPNDAADLENELLTAMQQSNRGE